MNIICIIYIYIYIYIYIIYILCIYEYMSLSVSAREESAMLCRLESVGRQRKAVRRAGSERKSGRCGRTARRKIWRDREG